MMTVRMIRDHLPPGYTGAPYAVTQVSAGDPMRYLALVAKLHEEAAEIGKAMDDVNEYADLLAVAFALAQLNGISVQNILQALAGKEAINGGFLLGKVMVRK